MWGITWGPHWSFTLCTKQGGPVPRMAFTYSFHKHVGRVCSTRGYMARGTATGKAQPLPQEAMSDQGLLSLCDWKVTVMSTPSCLPEHSHSWAGLVWSLNPFPDSYRGDTKWLSMLRLISGFPMTLAHLYHREVARWECPTLRRGDKGAGGAGQKWTKSFSSAFSPTSAELSKNVCICWCSEHWL